MDADRIAKKVSRVSREALLQAVQQATSTKSYTHRMGLVAAVAAILRKTTPELLVVDVADAVKHYELSLPLATTTRKQQRAANAERRLHLARLYATTPVKYHRLVERIGQGSRAAATKLHCLQCTCFCVAEIRHCGIMDCGNWDFRPFQPKN
jgi:isocitrate dehydrogenase